MIYLWQTAGQGAELPGGYGWELLRAALSLVAVCVVAWVVLRWASRRGLGGAAGSGRMEVLERLPLDPRRSLHLVRVGERVLVVATGEGAPALLTELALAELPKLASEPKGSFTDVLGRLRPAARGAATDEPVEATDP